jgi:hypothetical protein
VVLPSGRRKVRWVVNGPTARRATGVHPSGASGYELMTGARRGKPPQDGGSRLERVQLVLALMDDAVARLRDLVPGTGEIAERLRHDDPGLVREPCRTGLSGYWWRRVLTAVE